MKRSSIKVNKQTKNASISLNAINDFDQGNQVTSLNKIEKLFISKIIYVAYLKSNNSSLNFNFDKLDVITINTHKWYDFLAIRIDNQYLSDVLNAATQNNERTEIYYVDEYDWNKYLEQECRMQQ